MMSKYRGVRFHKEKQRWQAQLSCGRAQRIHLGYFDSEIEAAKAYDNAAKRRYGEAAVLNFKQ